MADYKKKRHQNGVTKKQVNGKKYSDEYDEIEFSSKKRPIKVSEKKRNTRKGPDKYTRIFISTAFIILFLAAFFILRLLHPVGVIEYINHVYSSWGTTGSYSIEIDGGKPSSCINFDNMYALVTDTSINIYNRNGKTVLEAQHNYSQPVFKCGDTRYLLYGQGEKTLDICTLTKTVYKHTFDKNIICAAISHSGNYAVATKADGYDSKVMVFNKNNKKVYEWYSTDETVNSIALSNDGKSLAVATVKVENGKFVSNFYVFKYTSANPVLSRNYSDNVIYKIDSTASNIFCLSFDNSLVFINFKKNTDAVHSSEYLVSMIKHYGNKTIVMRTVAANQDESLFEIYSSRGKLISSFKTGKNVTDYSYSNGNIYTLGLSDIYKYNEKGNLSASTPSAYDAVFIEAISSDNIALVCNSTVEKYKLNSVEDKQ